MVLKSAPRSYGDLSGAYFWPKARRTVQGLRVEGPETGWPGPGSDVFRFPRPPWEAVNCTPPSTTFIAKVSRGGLLRKPEQGWEHGGLRMTLPGGGMGASARRELGPSRPKFALRSSGPSASLELRMRRGPQEGALREALGDGRHAVGLIVCGFRLVADLRGLRLQVLEGTI